jgi:hypothetical protein
VRLIISAIVILQASGVAIAIDDDPNKQFDARGRQREKSSITWRVAENVQAACEKESRARGKSGFGYSLNACTFWDGDSCLIITRAKTSMHTLGHELRHCFYGNWH